MQPRAHFHNLHFKSKTRVAISSFGQIYPIISNQTATMYFFILFTFLWFLPVTQEVTIRTWINFSTTRIYTKQTSLCDTKEHIKYRKGGLLWPSKTSKMQANLPTTGATTWQTHREWFLKDYVQHQGCSPLAP